MHRVAILLLLPACGFGLDGYSFKEQSADLDSGDTDGGTDSGADTDTDGDTDTDTGTPIPPAGTPELDALVPYRNEDTVTVAGSVTDAQDVFVTADDGTTRNLPAVLVGERFTLDVTLTRGLLTTFTAVARDSRGDLGGVSTPVQTLACDPWDAWELIGAGDTCEAEPVVLSTALPDDGSTVVAQGNALEAGDEDWYVVTALDDGVRDTAQGFENFRFHVVMTAGEGAYQFTVGRGGCAAYTCTDAAGYTEYDYFAEDVTPDESGALPADPRACGTPETNECADLGATYSIRVFRIDGGTDCTGYTLTISNGVW